MRSQACRLAARYREGSSQREQAETLAKALVGAVSEIASNGLQDLAKRAVSRALGQDKDGSLSGAVYHDGFDKQAFVRLLVKKLSSDKEILKELADQLLMALEDHQ